MKTIIIGLFVGLLIVLAAQVYSSYRILSNAKYDFADISNIALIFRRSKKTLNIQIFNPLQRALSLKDVTIDFMKGNEFMEGFLPADIKISKGTNNVALEFVNSTKYMSIATDYLNNKLSDYTMVIRGNWLGLVPFKYSYKMKNII